MKYDLVIWDFNGTIADDVDIGIEAANVVLSKRGMKTIDDVEKYRDAFCFPIKEYYKNLGFDFTAEPYEVPADEWTAEYIKRENRIKLSAGCKKTLSAIKTAGIPQIIISSSEITMLKRECEMLGITEFFDSILGKSDNYASGKVELAKTWAADKSHKAALIGDTDHDYLTAKAVGADCYLFSGGHMSKKRLEKLGAPLIDNLEDVLRFIL